MTNFTRLARSVSEVLRITDLLSHRGITLHFIAQRIHSTDPNFRLMMSVCGMADDDFIERLGEKVRRGQHGRVLQGCSVGGRCYGYVTTPVACSNGTGIGGMTLVVVEPEADTIRRIYRDYASGTSAPKIAKMLNAEQVPSPRANGLRFTRWTSRNVYAVLRQHLYRGTVVWGRTRAVRHPEAGKVARLRQHQRDVVSMHTPALRIIDADLASVVDHRLATMDGEPEAEV